MRLCVAFCLVSSLASAQSLSVPATVANGAVIPVTVSNATGPNNWIGLYLPGTNASAYLQWQYLNGLQTAPSATIPSATLQLAPVNPGAYEVRLYTPSLSATAAVTVGAIVPPLVDAVLVNGDSNTDVAYIAPPQNWASLVAVGLGRPIINMAVAGKYSAGVVLDLPAMIAQHAAVCLVMIGGNDMAAAVYYGTTAQALVTYLAQMRTVIDGLKPACGTVTILTPPFTLQALEAARFDAWMTGLRHLTAELGVKLIDLYGHMRALAAGLTQAQFESYYILPSVDKYHLSPAGHALIAAYVLQQSRP